MEGDLDGPLFASAQPAKKARISRERRRELRAALACDEDNAGDIDWTERPSLLEMDSFVVKELRRLQRVNDETDLVPEAPPLSMMPPNVRRELDRNIGVLAARIEARTLRPVDADRLRALREAETAAATTVGPAGISVCPVRAMNPDYARNPLATADKPKLGRGQNIDHAHSKESTVVLEVRESLDMPLFEPLPEECLADELFTACAMPRDCVYALHRLDSHEAVEAACKILYRESENVASISLEAFIASISDKLTLSVFCVRFLHDAHVELIYYMDTAASYFAVLTFELVDYAGNDSKLAALREDVTEEMNRARTEAIERLKRPGTQETELERTGETDREKRDRELWVTDEREFRGLADLYHTRFDPASALEDQKTIARYCPLAVFAPDKSKTLMSVACRFVYHYYTTCQCLFKRQVEANAATTTRVVPAESQFLVEKSMVSSSVPFNFTRKR